MKTKAIIISMAAAFGMWGCDFSQNPAAPDSPESASELSVSAVLLVSPTYRGHSLPAGSRLNPGDYLLSPNGKYRLIMQGDGNLVAYRTWNNTWYWQTRTNFNTSPTSFCYAEMQTDGNFVVYKKTIISTSPILEEFTLQAVWNSRTQGHSNARLDVQDDNNIVVYWPGGAKGLYR